MNMQTDIAMPLAPAATDSEYDPEADVVRKVRSVSIALIVLFALFIVAGMLVPIGGAVIAGGQVGVESLSLIHI